MSKICFCLAIINDNTFLNYLMDNLHSFLIFCAFTILVVPKFLDITDCMLIFHLVFYLKLGLRFCII